MNILTGKYELENVTVSSTTSILNEEWTSIDPYPHTTTDSAGGLVLELICPFTNGHHFADDIFKCIFKKESFIFRFKFHRSFFFIDNISAFGLDNG